VRVSRAAADQRRGRAGRAEPGICLRLWDEAQTASLAPFAQPEILNADLSSFVLDLAQWGAVDPGALAFLDPPPQAALSETRALLRDLAAIDPTGRITEQGRRLRQLPLPPRLARMVVDAGRAGVGLLAAEIAALISERGLGGDDVDLTHRLDAFRRDRSRRGQEARQMAQRWAGLVAGSKAVILAERAAREPLGSPGIGLILARAFPDRIAKNRGGSSGAFLLANGRGAQIDPASPLARQPFLAVADLAGSAAQSRILLAAPLELSDIEAHFSDRVEAREEVSFDPNAARLRTRFVRRLGTLTLSQGPRAVSPDESTAQLLADGIVRLGLDRLPWTNALRQWRDRVIFLRRVEGEEWPDLSDAALAETAAEWLVPALTDKTALLELSTDELTGALQQRIPWPLRRRLDAEAPTHFEAPSGSRVPIDYDDPAGPKLAIRVQELFGLDRHPSIAGGKAPLVLELLSPAHRPVQITRDLPAFWRGSYASVRSEMRGRYPRHPWPDDPLAAPATRRAKPRVT
jgi:ATP-dependent helicase HrpB